MYTFILKNTRKNILLKMGINDKVSYTRDEDINTCFYGHCNAISCRITHEAITTKIGSIPK